ncbi:hypothetical protein DMC64_41455 [Amycolatopsis sp. WAC 04197]|uniref:hypothetical protein n=1 Tax=Amycolatopsis sp. WAC 04197 TaxID=2203199 RepID=UPI000F77B1CB|nr:hypothetical protein [Amycolatopsis sp. WAC 04197]RSN38537.1 hypothetical protein DMC64_41455 [Amycolatopsis sp. WAC 04197]
MTEFERYLRRATQYHDDHPDQREGQAAFNQLKRERPDLAAEIRGTDLDPFDDSERLPAFLDHLATRMTRTVHLHPGKATA